MQVTTRDIALLQWINGFGFVFIRHIASWMSVTYQTTHTRIKKLEQTGFIRQEQKTFSVPHLIYLTRKGWQLSGDELPCLECYNRLNSFNHDVRLIELGLSLEQNYPNSIFIPERRILHHNKVKRKRNLPDGELHFPEINQTIAIELELTRKSKHRLDCIIRQYRANLYYDAVWYFSPPPLLPVLKKSIGDDPFFVLKPIEYHPCL